MGVLQNRFKATTQKKAGLLLGRIFNVKKKIFIYIYIQYI